VGKKEVVATFKTLGQKASYHYADDSCREWDQAREYKKIALDLFDACPEYQNEMREVAKRFLWSLKEERPYSKEGEKVRNERKSKTKGV